MEYVLLYLFAVVVLIAISRVATAKIPSSTLRVFLRTGAIALLVAPTAVGGHGLYVGPAIILCFWGPADLEVFLRFCVLPMLVVWLVLFAVGWVWCRVAEVRARREVEKQANQA